MRTGRTARAWRGTRLVIEVCPLRSLQFLQSLSKFHLKHSSRALAASAEVTGPRTRQVLVPSASRTLGPCSVVQPPSSYFRDQCCHVATAALLRGGRSSSRSTRSGCAQKASGAAVKRS